MHLLQNEVVLPQEVLPVSIVVEVVHAVSIMLEVGMNQILKMVAIYVVGSADGKVLFPVQCVEFGDYL